MPKEAPQGKRGRGRPAGSGNKPKTVAQLEKELDEARKREGISTGKTSGVSDNDSSIENNPEMETLEITTPTPEENTFVCGECGHKQKSKFNICPECETTLEWGN